MSGTCIYTIKSVNIIQILMWSTTNNSSPMIGRINLQAPYPCHKNNYLYGGIKPFIARKPTVSITFITNKYVPYTHKMKKNSSVRWIFVVRCEPACNWKLIIIDTKPSVYFHCYWQCIVNKEKAIRWIPTHSATSGQGKKGPSKAHTSPESGVDSDHLLCGCIVHDSVYQGTHFECAYAV